MSFLEKVSENKYRIHLNVKTNAKKQNLIDNGKFLTIYLRSKAIQNKANKELINLIKKKLELSSNKIKIISGIKNTNKLIQVIFEFDINEQAIYNKLFGVE